MVICINVYVTIRGYQESNIHKGETNKTNLTEQIEQKQLSSQIQNLADQTKAWCGIVTC